MNIYRLLWLTINGDIINGIKLTRSHIDAEKYSYSLRYRLFLKKGDLLIVTVMCQGEAVRILARSTIYIYHEGMMQSRVVLRTLPNI